MIGSMLFFFFFLFFFFSFLKATLDPALRTMQRLEERQYVVVVAGVGGVDARTGVCVCVHVCIWCVRVCIYGVCVFA